jgi:hypothetical protein
MSEELVPEEPLPVPTTAEFAYLSAVRSGRLRRFYYVTGYSDAVVSGLMGGGGKVQSSRLNDMVELYGWLEPMPETSSTFDAGWKITEAGEEARRRYLSRPRGPYKVGGKKK